MEQQQWISIGILILGWIFIVVAIIGSVLPALPGPPLAMIPIFLLPIFHLYNYNWIHIVLIIILSIIVIATIILDYMLPGIMTKYFGGSKYATW
jgi:hypothetical protein